MTKQDGITTSTNLECNSFAGSNLVVKGEKFDTILIRRTDATGAIMNLRTLQIYVNNVNILATSTSSTQSTGIVGGAIGNVIEFITWNNLLTYKPHFEFIASRIRENNITDSHRIFSFNAMTPYISLYIPLTQTFNISDIQSFVLYNRNNNASDQLRIQGFQTELYNRFNGFTAGENILYTMPINTSAPVNRFDLPSISTYTLGLSDDDSQSFVKDIAVSDSFRTILLNVEDGNVDLGGNLIITGDLVVGDVNIITEINTKQDLILDGDLTIAKTDGLLTALDSTAKLALANTFTGLQTVNGDLKADHVLVKITAPTLNTHLTSKLYVDTALIGKQNTLTAGTGIDITDNVISSTSTSSNSSFVGFRVETAQEVDMRIGTGSTIPFNVKTGGIGFLYDTHDMYNITTYEYTIPVGYSGYWFFNMRLFIAEYAENKRRIHLRVTRGSSNFEPLQIGNFYGQVESLSGTIPVLEGDVIKVFVHSGDGLGVFIYASRDNCWFEGRYMGI